jgi:AraC-like DNA-binding protein
MSTHEIAVEPVAGTRARSEVMPIVGRTGGVAGPVDADATAAMRYSLPVEAIRPFIRIAHRQRVPLRVAHRIILDHEFVLVLAGEGRFSTPHGSIRFAPHQLFCIRPFLPHEFEPQRGDGEHIAVHFDVAADVPAERYLRPDRPRPYQVRFPDGSYLGLHHRLAPGDGIEALFLDLLQSWNQRSPLGRLDAHGSLQRIIAKCLGMGDAREVVGGVDAVARERIQRAIAHMERHVAEPLTIAELARVSGLSASRFGQVFKDHTGYPPKGYLLRLRIEHARRLLADIDLSVKEVARRVGSPDQFHFSRMFRRIDGLSPSHYRQAVMAGRRATDPD